MHLMNNVFKISSDPLLFFDFFFTIWNTLLNHVFETRAFIANIAQIWSRKWNIPAISASKRRFHDNMHDG